MFTSALRRRLMSSLGAASIILAIWLPTSAAGNLGARLQAASGALSGDEGGPFMPGASGASPADVVEVGIPDLVAPAVDVGLPPNGVGHWIVAADGGVFAYGGAPFLGSAAGQASATVVAVAGTADGYWLATSAGDVFAFGSARHHGDVGHLRLNAPVASITAAPRGDGYWMVARDGGVFALGGARFYGSGAGSGLDVVDLVPTASGRGYWLIASSGSVIAMGDAVPLAAPGASAGRVVDAASRSDGVVLVWDSGVVDHLGPRDAIREATFSLTRPVGVATAEGATVVAVGDRPLRRLGPSVSSHPPDAARGFGVTSGAHVGIVSFYADFDSTPDFPVAVATELHQMGALPFVTWEPWDHRGGRWQVDYQLRDVYEGRHDALIDRWAAQIAAFEQPVLIRFAHEMNGDWYPWSEQVNGNEAGEFRLAWRHVHSRFAAAGADNVVWVWNPNVETPTSTPLADLYPGRAYVDLVALDGYNAGSALPWGGWRTGADILGQALAELRAVDPTIPVMIGETASSEAGGDKALWIRDLFGWLGDQQPDIVAVMWFDEAKETSWNLASSEASRRAFADAATRRWCNCRR